MTDRIDAHQHFWDPARGDYGWMPKDHPILSRVYGPEDLAPMLRRHDIARTVLVQAAPTIAETDHLLEIADDCPDVAGVVGWIDFEDPSDKDALARLAAHPKFLGVRPMIQDIPDDAWMLRDNVAWAYRAIIDMDLTFDALGFPRHMGHFLTLLTRHREMRVVLDHCLKPQIRAHSETNFRHWADGISALAGQSQAFCKLSGIVTECDGWSVEKLQPYVDHVITAFGPDRVMWGSDWPVCLLEARYEEWLETAEMLTRQLSPDARAMVFGGTAARFYRI